MQYPEEDSGTPSQSAFRNGMALLTGAVNIITTDGAEGKAGITASAVCSITDQPPSLLVCINRASSVHRLIQKNGCLCVNVLDADDLELSRAFADRAIPMDARFGRAAWRPLYSGAPALESALVNFDGHVTVMHDVGTHSIFYVQVKHIRSLQKSAEHVGLAYFNRAYHKLPAQ